MSSPTGEDFHGAYYSSNDRSTRGDEFSHFAWSAAACCIPSLLSNASSGWVALNVVIASCNALTPSVVWTGGPTCHDGRGKGTFEVWRGRRADGRQEKKAKSFYPQPKRSRRMSREGGRKMMRRKRLSASRAHASRENVGASLLQKFTPPLHPLLSVLGEMRRHRQSTMVSNE